MNPISPDQLSPAQQPLDERVRGMLDGLRTPFTTTDENGALIGPFPVMLRFPELARPLLEWSTAVTNEIVLPVRVLTPEETVAHDVAARLHTGGPLPGALYRAAVESFGEFGTAELVFLIAQYASISLVLNAYDVPSPPDAEC